MVAFKFCNEAVKWSQCVRCFLLLGVVCAVPSILAGSDAVSIAKLTDSPEIPETVSLDVIPPPTTEDFIVSRYLRIAKQQMEALRLANPAADLSVLASPVLKAKENGSIQVHVRLEQVSESVIRQLTAAGLSVENSSQRMGVVKGWISYTSLDELAKVQGVRRIRPPVYPVTNTGSVNTAGDGILEADDLRSVMSATGDGIKVGVISDGVDHWTDVKASPFFDLPSSITIHPTLSGSGDEGTAMLEIVYDLAPGADLYFAGLAGGDSTDMVTAIEWMVNQGCDVIVDDVSWFDQPMFEDGAIADLDGVADDSSFTLRAALHVVARLPGDYRFLHVSYGTISLNPEPIPEPTSLIVLAFGAVGFLRRKRNRICFLT